MGDDLSPGDRAALARLVGKYGREFIIAAAKRIRPPRRPGRPRMGDKWDDVEWIEQRADELRREGVVHGALKAATVERFLKITPREKHNDAGLAKFEKMIKNARGEWSKTKRLIKAARRDIPRARRRRRPLA